MIATQCRINHGAGGAPAPGPLSSGGLIISQLWFLHVRNIPKMKTVQFYASWILILFCIFKYLISAVLEILVYLFNLGFRLLLRHYLTLPVTNCTGERSFSHLKRIKSALRSTQAQERLNNLSLLNIESDLLQKLDFSTVIDAFSSAKCRKRSFWLSELLKYL